MNVFLGESKMNSALEEMTRDFRRDEAARLSDAWKNYRRRVVQRLVAGEVVEQAEVRKLLEAAGRTIDDLPKDVDNQKSRDAMRKRIKDATDAKPKLAAARMELEKLKAERQKFIDDITPKIEAAAAVADSHNAVVNAAQSCVLQLRSTCGDPGLQKEIDSIDDDLRDLLGRESTMALVSSENRDAHYGATVKEIRDGITALRVRRDTIVAEQESQ